MNTLNLMLTYDFHIKRLAEEKRKYNIQAFSELQREGLEFRKIERKLYIYDTKNNERIWIQYPGKETLNGKPWDFRPKMSIQNGKNTLPDLAFPDIWDDLAEIQTGNSEVLSVLAAILFRMAFMVGYKKKTKVCQFEDVNIETKQIINIGHLEHSFYVPELDEKIVIELQNQIGYLRGASLEAYLLYNDLLAQNEDCKYYYRDIYEKGVKWNSSVGRRNTLLTHLSVIEYIQGGAKFSEIMNRFQKGRGVAPITLNSISTITNGIINKS